MRSANDIQIGGDHYKGQAIQHWDFVIFNTMPYLEAMVCKYISRWKDKEGLQDLEKAAHFIDKIIEVYKEHAAYGISVLPWPAATTAAEWVNRLGLPYIEGEIIGLMYSWRTSAHPHETLVQAKTDLARLIEQVSNLEGAAKFGRAQWIRMRDREIIMEQLNDMRARLEFVLQHAVTSEDGHFTFPDGASYVVPYGPPMEYDHRTTTLFELEGFKGSDHVVLYRHRQTRVHFECPRSSNPYAAYRALVLAGKAPAAERVQA